MERSEVEYESNIDMREMEEQLKKILQYSKKKELIYETEGKHLIRDAMSSVLRAVSAD